VPTPFYHLKIAEALREQAGVQPEVQDQINTSYNAFQLGNIAPDVQVISGQTRESTHFYNLPVQIDDVPPWERILNSYSSLSWDCIKNPEKLVFVAGYLCHLQADWFWVRQIFEPYFGPDSHWKTFRERLYLHNVLRSYLDYRLMESIRPEALSGLSQSNPKAWLPFIDVEHLEAWRDFLADQLKPGAFIQTVEVFSSRQGISAENYYRILNSEDEMKNQVFNYFPRKLLEDYWRELLSENVTLLNEYLGEVGGYFNANT